MKARYQAALTRIRNGTATRGDMALVRDYEAQKYLQPEREPSKVAETKPKPK